METKKINDEITIAGQITPEQLQQAAQEGYKSVFNLRSPEEQGFLPDEQQQAEFTGLQYKHIPVKPNAMTEELTTQVLAEIDQLPKPVLIHCASAMRAGAMALMHLATREGMTPEQVFAKAASVGFDCSANPQIKQFVEQYISQSSHS